MQKNCLKLKLFVMICPKVGNIECHWNSYSSELFVENSLEIWAVKFQSQLPNILPLFLYFYPKYLFSPIWDYCSLRQRQTNARTITFKHVLLCVLSLFLRCKTAIRNWNTKWHRVHLFINFGYCSILKLLSLM